MNHVDSSMEVMWVHTRRLTKIDKAMRWDKLFHKWNKRITADDYILFATIVEIYPEIDLDLSLIRVDLIGERFDPFTCCES